MLQERKLSCNDPYESEPRLNDSNTKDWICINCNNLNFSFRKMCNRCKVQSREENHKMMYADYFYYSQFYQYQSSQLQQIYGNKPSSLIKKRQKDCPPRGKRQYRSQPDMEDEEIDDLPSVSSLLKKYRDGKAIKQSENPKFSNRSQISWKLFGDQIWNTVQSEHQTLNSLCKDSLSTDDEEASQQFRLSVERMII